LKLVRESFEMEDITTLIEHRCPGSFKMGHSRFLSLLFGVFVPSAKMIIKMHKTQENAKS
jgi:hypothetical protein